MASRCFPSTVASFAFCCALLALSSQGAQAYPNPDSHPYHFHPPRLPSPAFEFDFYMHSNLYTPTGRNSFAVTLPVAKVGTATLSDQSWFLEINETFFGAIVVFEDSITVAPDAKSTEVGTGRGIYVHDKNAGAANGVEWLFTAIFNDESGLGNSTLCFRGFDLGSNAAKGLTELTICGGTGKFRLARGYASVLVTVPADAPANSASCIMKFGVHLYY